MAGFVVRMIFEHNFHDSRLVSFELGPRRELKLKIDLDPVWNKKGASSVTVRFGGIENYDEVVSFFLALPKPLRTDAYIAEITGLRIAGDKKETVIELEDRGGIRVRSLHIDES